MSRGRAVKSNLLKGPEVSDDVTDKNGRELTMTMISDLPWLWLLQDDTDLEGSQSTQTSVRQCSRAGIASHRSECAPAVPCHTARQRPAPSLSTYDTAVHPRTSCTDWSFSQLYDFSVPRLRADRNMTAAAFIRAGLTSMPIMPWHGAPRFRGPPWVVRIF